MDLMALSIDAAKKADHGFTFKKAMNFVYFLNKFWMLSQWVRTGQIGVRPADDGACYHVVWRL
jgi:hypothetical protein